MTGGSWTKYVSSTATRSSVFISPPIVTTYSVSGDQVDHYIG